MQFFTFRYMTAVTVFIAVGCCITQRRGSCDWNCSASDSLTGKWLWHFISALLSYLLAGLLLFLIVRNEAVLCVIF